MASWHCWSLWGKFLLLGYWGLTQDWHISWPWGILGSLAFLVQSVWLCCGFRDFKNSWKYLETLKQCEVLMVLSFNFLYSGASHCLIQSEFLLLPPEARESLKAVSGQSNFSGFAKFEAPSFLQITWILINALPFCSCCHSLHKNEYYVWASIAQKCPHQTLLNMYVIHTPKLVTPQSPESNTHLLSAHCCEQGTQLWPVCSENIEVPNSQIPPGSQIQIPAGTLVSVFALC